MGLASTNNRVVLNGDGIATSFNFPYYFFAQTDLNVYIWDTLAGTVTAKVLGTDYTISGTPNYLGLYVNGANIVFGAAPSSTQVVVVVRNPPEVQNYSILQNGLISTTALVQQMDYLTMLIQRLEDQMSRAITLPDGVGATFNPQLPNNTTFNAGAFVQINAAANGISLQPNAGWTKTTIPYTTVQNAALTKQIQLFTLPAGAMLTGAVAKHSQQFTGSGITDVFVQVGTNANAGLMIGGFDIFQAVGDSIFDSILANYILSWANSTTIYATFTSVGANLSLLSQGSIDLYYQWQQVKN